LLRPVLFVQTFSLGEIYQTSYFDQTSGMKMVEVEYLRLNPWPVWKVNKAWPNLQYPHQRWIWHVHSGQPKYGCYGTCVLLVSDGRSCFVYEAGCFHVKVHVECFEKFVRLGHTGTLSRDLN